MVFVEATSSPPETGILVQMLLLHSGWSILSLQAQRAEHMTHDMTAGDTRTFARDDSRSSVSAEHLTALLLSHPTAIIS